MKIYPDPNIIVDAIAAEFAKQASANGTQWTLAEPVEIREMPWSTLYFITFNHGDQQEKVVAKIGHYPDQTTPELSWTDPDMVLRGEREYDSMMRIYDHFQQSPEDGLATIQARAYIPEYNIVVMPFVEHETVYDHCMSTRKLLRASELEKNLSYVRRAGCWLRKMHSLPLGDVPQDRTLGPQESVSMMLDEVENLKKLGVDINDFPEWEETLRILKGVKTKNLVWVHDDYHMRNVFVLPNDDILSLDTALNFADSPYVDIGKILSDMKTRRARVMRFGMLPSARAIDRFRQAFLDGYFGGEPIDELRLALYEGRFLIQKWAESLAVIQEKLPSPLAAVVSTVPVNLVFQRMVLDWMESVLAAHAAVQAPTPIRTSTPIRGERSMLGKLISDKRVLALVAFGVLYSIITFLIPFILPEETVARQVREDSLIEYLGALGFFVASMAFLAAFFLEKTGNRLGSIRTPRNLVYLGLAAILLFGAGEEISWGQRIIGFETPDTFEENEQDETSIHNLPLFNTTNAGNLLQFNRLFILFWFTLGVAIPVAALSSKRVRDWLRELGMPVVPLAIGGLFLINYVLSKVYGFVIDDDKLEDPLRWDGRVSEIRESQEGIIFALIGIYILLLVLERREKPEPEAQPANQHHNDAQAETAV